MSATAALLRSGAAHQPTATTTAKTATAAPISVRSRASQNRQRWQQFVSSKLHQQQHHHQQDLLPHQQQLQQQQLQQQQLNKSIDILASELHIKNWKDWYGITQQHVRAHGGSKLLEHFSGSLVRMLQTFYPYYAWIPWKFHKMQHSYWENNIQQQRELLESQFRIVHWEQWYSVTNDQIRARGAGRLLQHYGGSRKAMLETLFPYFPWNSAKFHDFSNSNNGDLDRNGNGKEGARSDRLFWGTSRGHWSVIAHQRHAMQQLAKALSIREQEDWYGASVKQMSTPGTGGLLYGVYKGSPARMLQTLYPEFQWQPWRFSKVPAGFWGLLVRQRQAVENLAVKLQVQNWEDWYHVTVDQVKSHRDSGVATLLRMDYGWSIYRMMEALFPEHPWEPSKFVQNRQAGRKATGSL